MSNTPPTYHFAIIGGGLFGCYAALYLAGKGYQVLLIEKETELLSKASVVNQARLHAGYHYPRSVATALMSDDHRERFTREHRAFINGDFDQYYAIDRYSSFTDPVQFERFCEHIGLPYKKVDQQEFFNFERLEALYLTQEQSFDPVLIAAHYRRRITAQPRIVLQTNSCVHQVDIRNDRWEIAVLDQSNRAVSIIQAEQVINATYAASNAVHRLFGLDPLPLMHELSEIAFVHSPQLSQLGLTIMDGPFASLMPYGHSGMLSLSSVAYTHHKVSYEELPTFDCQLQRADCRPELTANCTDCAFHPRSNYPKMLAQISLYFQPQVQFRYIQSMYTIKSKLKANYIDDGRPTEISLMRENPRFYCIFAGKINSIYEVEKVLDGTR